jgi:hypothetical protein
MHDVAGQDDDDDVEFDGDDDELVVPQRFGRPLFASKQKKRPGPHPPAPREEDAAAAEARVKRRPAQRNVQDSSTTKKGPTRPAAIGMSQATDTARGKHWTGNQQRRAAQHPTWL